MINIFKKGSKTLTTDIDTYVVRWNKVYGKYIDEYQEYAQFFTSKEEAEEFADSLRRAIRLLGHTAKCLTWVECKKVKNNGVD